MFITAEQIFAAMSAIVEAPGYPLLQTHKDDFYESDLAKLKCNWFAQPRAIWVVTPNGTFLRFYGHHKRQVHEIESIVYSGYRNQEIYTLTSTGIKRITAAQAVEEAKKLDFHVKNGAEVTDSQGNTVAYMRITQTGHSCRRRTNVHYEPGSAFTGSPSQLVALGNIADQASIEEVQTLFMAVERITVGDALWTETGLVKVQCKPDDQTKSVIFSPAEFENEAKGFYNQRRNCWCTLPNATPFESHNAWISSPIGSEVISLKDARFMVAQKELCPAQ